VVAVKSMAGCGVMSLVWYVETNFTFRGPCIMIFSYNKTNKMH